MVGCATNAELNDQCSGWMVVTSGPHSLHGLHMHNLLQVLSSYREEGFGFLVKVFNSSDHLEQLTGLHHLYSAADRADVSCLLAHMGGEGVLCAAGSQWLAVSMCSTQGSWLCVAPQRLVGSPCSSCLSLDLGAERR